MNDAVILLCGVILLLAILPMVLMGRAFKGAGSRTGAPGTPGTDSGADSGLAGVDLAGAAKTKTGHGPDDSGGQGDAGGDSGGGDGGGGGE